MAENGKFKATFFTLFSAIFNSVLLMIFNLIYNNLLITHYGSDTSGLITTLTQFVSLFAILEGGFSVAAIVASYEPIVKKDFDKLNDILYTISKYLRIIAVIYFIISFGAGMVYIQFVDLPLPFWEASLLLLLTVITTALSLGLLSKYTIVLSGYNKKYIVIFISSLSKTLIWIVSICLIISDKSILIVYMLNILNILVNVCMLRSYEKKYYPYINYRGKYNKKLIKGTKDVLFQKIASTIFTSTDLVLISVEINFSLANVYNLYNQIFQAIFNFLLSICDSPTNSFGQLLNGGEEEQACKLFSIFEKSVQIISSVFLSVVGMSIICFMRVYSKNFSDENYIIPSLVFLFFAYFYVKLNNSPFGQFLNAAGQFKLQNIQCAVGAIVNLVLSIVLIKSWGLNGVVFGSVCGTIVIMTSNLVCCYKKIIKTGCIKTVIALLTNFICGMVLIYFSFKVDYVPNNYVVWFYYTVICMIVASITFIILNILIDFTTTKETMSYFMTKLKQKKKVLFKRF